MNVHNQIYVCNEYLGRYLITLGLGNIILNEFIKMFAAN